MFGGMKTAIIDTTPSDMRNQGSINLGLEIAKEQLSADVYRWTDILTEEYDQIAFNVFYPTNMLNIGPFLLRNNIKPLRTERTKAPLLIAGGQGIGKNGILSEVMDIVFDGEIDEEENEVEIVSRPVIKDGKAVIELTRGCKYRCKFCEYGCVAGGKYREKNLDLVKSQICEVIKQGVRRVNFMSANFSGYSEFDKLMEFCYRRAVSVMNGDVCLRDAGRIIPHLKMLPRMIKTGVESLDFNTRKSVGKNITDAELFGTLRQILKVSNGLHLYLIYGLPGDNYEAWFDALKELAKLRDEHSFYSPDLWGNEERFDRRKIRIEMSITNFEPCAGTPLAGAAPVDFVKKDEFLKMWIAANVKNRFMKHEEIDYKNSGGRIGRKEHSYRLLMALKNGGPELTDKIIYSMKKGIGRSISDVEALRFLEYGGRL